MTPLHHAVNAAHVRTRVSAMTSMMMTPAEQSLRYILCPNKCRVYFMNNTLAQNMSFSVDFGKF